MCYELSAVISTPEALEPICARYRCAHLVALAIANLALIPLIEGLVLELDSHVGRVSPETGFQQLSVGVLALLVTCGCRTGHPRYATWAYSCINPPSKSRRRR